MLTHNLSQLAPVVTPQRNNFYLFRKLKEIANTPMIIARESTNKLSEKYLVLSILNRIDFPGANTIIIYTNFHYI
jgi:hypothetical protein